MNSKPKRTKTWWYIGIAFSIGFTIVSSILVGLYLGRILDERLLTGYSFRLLLMFLGAYVGLRSIYDQLKR
jgi:F0F1-type ATP synthase assembly protein I